LVFTAVTDWPICCDCPESG